MANATVAFRDLEGFAAASFPKVSRVGADQFYFKPEISSEDGFEGLVGKSQNGRSQNSIGQGRLAEVQRSALAHQELGQSFQSQSGRSLWKYCRLCILSIRAWPAPAICWIPTLESSADRNDEHPCCRMASTRRTASSPHLEYSLQARCKRSCARGHHCAPARDYRAGCPPTVGVENPTFDPFDLFPGSLA